ncbi:hypothetical protein EVAR_13178_1 [Eumeta japonica]|uniref:Reverse transcriptase domain-containing protein n=1 Tax=Eumeta variegata TaxID=151549 RepID=A0A4C1TS11_EUMVA|nr:hypothetical protein EVAR_13178_1 [Eumeta japonica]
MFLDNKLLSNEFMSGLDYGDEFCRPSRLVPLRVLDKSALILRIFLKTAEKAVIVPHYKGKGLRQSYLYDLKDYECRLKIDERSVKYLLYADDQIILAPSACKLQDGNENETLCVEVEQMKECSSKLADYDQTFGRIRMAKVSLSTSKLVIVTGNYSVARRRRESCARPSLGTLGRGNDLYPSIYHVNLTESTYAPADVHTCNKKNSAWSPSARKK